MKPNRMAAHSNPMSAFKHVQWPHKAAAKSSKSKGGKSGGKK